MGNLIRISSTNPTKRAARTERGRDSAPHVERPGRVGDGRLQASEDSMLDHLDRRDRLRLVEFVCSFAWADLEVKPEERVFISQLIRKLGLDAAEDLQVQKWLERPPSVDDIDPTSIPPEHRRLFVEAIEGLIASDGEIAEEEIETFEIFKQLLVG